MILYLTFKRNGKQYLMFGCYSYFVDRNRICTQATEAEVARAKNVFKTNLFMQLDGIYFNIPFINSYLIVNSQGLHQSVKILAGNLKCVNFCYLIVI